MIQKKRMRMLSTGLAAIAAAGLLAACGGSKEAGNSAVSSTSTSGSKAGNKNVAIVAAVQLPTQVTEMCAAKEVLTKAGYSVSIQYPKEYSASVQVPIFDSVMNTHPAGILLSPDDPKALEPPTKQAVSEGAKVVTIDLSLTSPTNAGVSSTVYSSDLQSGREAAELVGKQAKGRSGQVALLTYSPGEAAVADNRAKGFTEGIKKYPNLQLVSTLIADSLTEGAAKTNALLAAHPNLVAIDGDWTGAGEGMLQALRQRGLAGKVIAVANDGDEPLIQAIRAGDLYASVLPKILENGINAGHQLVNALSGKPTTPNVISGPVVATKANLGDPSVSRFFLNAKETC